MKALKLVLQQKQTLNLTMTTELRQAIELLQYSTYDLYQFLHEQGLENPLIELVEKEQIPSDSYRKKVVSSSASDDVDPFKFIADSGKGMCDKLKEQVSYLSVSETERKILNYLVFNLDENGYLTVQNIEVSEYLQVSEEEVESAIKQLQQLEPLGVGARSLEECLLLQAKVLYPVQLTLHEVIEEHLILLADKKWNELARKLSISLAEVKMIEEMIQTLDPKPCAMMHTSSVDYVTPDIIIEKVDDEFHITLNDYYIPEIKFNTDYTHLVDGKRSSYVQEHYRNLTWLQNSIEQRRTTILKIMHVLVQKQADFFEHGFSALKPLTLKDVADEIDMHESTVSRATANKVLQTSKGSFDLRMLFSTRLSDSNDESMSQTKVKLLLEKIISEENKVKPLSDQKIADYFKSNESIKISRRTIAKYREELHIPSSSRRKELHV